MALKNTYIAGDPLPAADVNDIVDAVLQADHNIFELALQNYFASLVTPVTGLLFDGFSDQTKADIASNTLGAQANSGQANLAVLSTTNFAINKFISIFDGLGTLEEKIIQSITAGLTNSIDQQQTDFSQTGTDWAAGATTGRWQAQSFQVSTAGKLKQVRVHFLRNANNTTFKCELQTDSAGSPSGTILETSDTIAPTSTGEWTFTFAGTLTLLPSTTYWWVVKPVSLDTNNNMDINGKGTTNPYANGQAKWTDNSGGTWTNGARQLSGDANADMYFKIVIDTFGTITLTTNLANTYAVGSAVRRTGVAFDTTNRKITIDETVQSSVFTDDFNRADSNTTGNGWTEVGVDDTGQRIVSNKLRLERTSASPSIYAVHRSLGAGLGAGLRSQIEFQIVTFPGTTQAYFYFFPYFSPADSSTNGLGIRVNFTNAAQQTLDIINNGAFPASTHNLTLAAATPYFFWVDFEGGTTPGTLKVKAYFATTNVKPGSPQVTADNVTPGSPSATSAKIAHESNGAGQAFDNNFVIINTAAVKTAHYYTKRNLFQANIALSELWVVRNFASRFNLASSIAQGATTLTITGDKTAEFANGDTIDIYKSTNEVRERKTLTATPTFGAGVTTLTFTTAIAVVGGFATSAFVERVDVLPKMSVVDGAANENPVAMTYVKSIVDFTNSEVEDEYTLTPGTPETDVTIKLSITRNTAAVVPYAKRLGATLHD